MRLQELSALYLAVGVACAVALYRREEDRSRRAVINALTAIPLWPLWAPIAWTARREPPILDVASSELVLRIRTALEEGVESVANSPLEQLLNRDSAKHIVGEVERVASRHQELTELLAREEFNREVAQRRLEALERAGTSVRALASARLHLENVIRLHHLAERDARALEELAGLVTALRTQLLLVRLSGSSAEGVGDIVSELWARIESLSEASDEALSTKHYVDTPA